MRRTAGIAILLITAGALALRLPDLCRRPMHTDESVQALKFRELWETGTWRYDPTEYHGPTLPYATLPAMVLSGGGSFASSTERTYRVVPALFGALTVLLLLWLADGLGGTAAVAAAVFIAVFPATVFYSRYYIHETTFAFFSLATIAAGWRYSRTPRLGWAVAAGAFAGLMYCTKETSIAAWAAMLAGLALTAAWGRFVVHDRSRLGTLPSAWHLAAAFATACVLAVVLFSAFFTNSSGPLDSIRTFGPWTHKAVTDTDHVHPWYWYFAIMLSGSAGKMCLGAVLVLCLAAAGLAAALRQSRTKPGGTPANVHLVRFLGICTIALAGFYCVMPYKTPWCMLGFVHGILLLAGVGAAVVLDAVPGKLKIAAGLVLALGAADIARHAWLVSFPRCTDPSNPYVYAHPSPDAVRLADEVKAIASAWREGAATPVHVAAPREDYWPLPWYLRSLTRVGWWSREPAGPAAPIVVAAREFEPALGLKLKDTHLMVGIFEFRPGVFMDLYVQNDLWRAYLEHRRRPGE